MLSINLCHMQYDQQYKLIIQKATSFHYLSLTTPLPTFTQIFASSYAKMSYFMFLGTLIHDCGSSSTSHILTDPSIMNISLIQFFPALLKMQSLLILQRKTDSKGDSNNISSLTPCEISLKSKILVFNLKYSLQSFDIWPNLTKILVPSLLNGACADLTGFLTYHPQEQSPDWSEKVPSRTQNSSPKACT